MLRDVLAECWRVLEPGGRARGQRRESGTSSPYRSLSADVIRILQDDLKMLLRGEVIWRKAAGASGSIAVGSYRLPSNPVLRDVTERVIVASKGRFDRAVPRRKRAERGLPHIATVSKEEFFKATLDVWEIQPAHASKVGHPAPFPLELPRRLINLYTYQDDLVLDPFSWGRHDPPRGDASLADVPPAGTRTPPTSSSPATGWPTPRPPAAG